MKKNQVPMKEQVTNLLDGAEKQLQEITLFYGILDINEITVRQMKKERTAVIQGVGEGLKRIGVNNKEIGSIVMSLRKKTFDVTNSFKKYCKENSIDPGTIESINQYFNQGAAS